MSLANLYQHTSVAKSVNVIILCAGEYTGKKS